MNRAIKLRQSFGLTESEFAILCDVPVGQVRLAENGAVERHEFTKQFYLLFESHPESTLRTLLEMRLVETKSDPNTYTELCRIAVMLNRRQVM